MVSPPYRYSTPFDIYPFPVDDSIPTVNKIGWAVHRLQQHSSGGGIRHESGAYSGVVVVVKYLIEAGHIEVVQVGVNYPFLF